MDHRVFEYGLDWWLLVLVAGVLIYHYTLGRERE